MSLKNTTYISVDRVFSRLKGSMPLDNEDDIIEWIGEAMEHIGAITQYREVVCFAEVKNYSCKVPKHNHSIIQIARNNFYSPKVLITPQDSINWLGAIRKPITLTDYSDGCVLLDERFQQEDCDLGYAPIFSLAFEFDTWISHKLYQKAFTPVLLTNHSFFNSVVCKQKDHDKIYKGCTDEYNIIDGTELRFSFKEGQVAIAYNQNRLSTDGLPMIPDDVSYVTAAVNYVRYKHFEREFYAGREGAESKMSKAETEWTWYCAQAGNKALMLSGEDEHQNFLSQRSYLLPQNSRYFNFFGGMNKPEQRNY